MMYTCHYILSEPIGYTIPRVNPKTSKLWTWVNMICQCKFIDRNKCTTLVENIDNGRGYVCVWPGVYWKSLYCPFDFAVTLKLL